MEFLQKHNKEDIVIALGFFDCLHVAHRKIIGNAMANARARSAKSCVLTFEGNVKNTNYIYNLHDRARLLSDAGVDYVLCYEFTSEFASKSAINFLEEITGDYTIKGIVCGYDYKFGKGAEGNVELLESFCKSKGIDLSVLDKQEEDGNKISTSLIKQLLSDGEIDKANQLLDAPYRISGMVVKGRGEGHLFGFPTANLQVESGKFLPKSGVYGTMCGINGKIYRAVTNVGTKPTFGDESISIETFIDGFNRDIYGYEIDLYFHKYLRETIKFDLPSQLKEQICKDMRW